MKIKITIIALLLITSVCCAQDVTFTSIQQEFQQKVLSLVPETDSSQEELNEKILIFGQETFGNHPKVVKKETMKRFKQLPVFPEASLKEYTAFATLSQSLMTDSDSDLTRLSLLLGWTPEKMADWVKQTFLARHLELSKLSQRATLNNWYPDKTYRIETNAQPKLVLESLGDIFIIKLALTDQGVFKPISAQWMKRKSETKAL